jgi:ATP-dependent protease ClpP protease subunit
MLFNFLKVELQNMSWNGNNDALTLNCYKNYMYNDKVFILDEITADNCAYLIGDLTQYVLNEQNVRKKLMFIINSPGGDVSVMITLLGLMNMARLNNIEIYTFVLGSAGSAASILAANGDQRFINSLSKHFIHFGCIFDITQKHSEIEKVYIQNKEHAENIINLYLNACDGKLKREKLLEIQADERGYLNAADCLKYGLADVVIENDLQEKLKTEQDFAEYEKGFDSWLKNKYSKKNKSKNSTKSKKK